MRPETVKKRFIHLEFVLITQGSIATHGIGFVNSWFLVNPFFSSTRPNKSIDAGVLSSDLAGVMMAAPDSKPEYVGIPGLSLQYDEVRVYPVLHTQLADLSLLSMMFPRSKFGISFVSGFELPADIKLCQRVRMCCRVSIPY
jgi:hypothetical protein